MRSVRYTAFHVLYRAIKHLVDVLKPHSDENGGPLKVEHVSFVEGRGNLIIRYTPDGPTHGEETVSSLS